MTTPEHTQIGEPTPRTLYAIFCLGIVSLVATIALCVLMAFLDWGNEDSPYPHSYKLFIAHVMAGRMGNAGLGLHDGFPMWFIAFQCFIQDFIFMCFGYPLFVWGYKKFTHWPVIGAHLDEAHQAALMHRDRIRPYGMLGLMLFVIFPMWSTGPLVGVIMGYLIGLGAISVFVSISVANLASTLLYVYAFEWLQNYNAQLFFWVVVVVFAFAITIFVARFLWSRFRAAQPAS